MTSISTRSTRRNNRLSNDGVNAFSNNDVGNLRPGTKVMPAVATSSVIKTSPDMKPTHMDDSASQSLGLNMTSNVLLFEADLIARVSASCLRTIRACNNFDRNRMSSSDASAPLRFMVKGMHVGNIRRSHWLELERFPDVFTSATSQTPSSRPTEAHIVDDANLTPDEITARVKRVVDTLRKDDRIECLRGWRNEIIGVAQSFHAPALFYIERASAAMFGTRKYGVHLNVFTFKDGQMQMWIAKRSPTKQTYPNMFDQLVAGGIPAGEDVMEALIRECDEEAGMDPELARKSLPVDVVSYFLENETRFEVGTEFCYDLEVDASFTPVNQDGEVAGFSLHTMLGVMQMILEGNVKPNVVLVIVSFFIRHGIFTPDNCESYGEIVTGLHRNNANL